MFDNLTARLARSIESLRGKGRITDENVAETLREVRVALLEADVALPVVKTFIDGVKAKALGAEVASSLTPGQALIGILHKELVELMGGPRAGFNLRAQPPIVVLLAGLQGAGKTTTCAKIAKRPKVESFQLLILALRAQHSRRPLRRPRTRQPLRPVGNPERRQRHQCRILRQHIRLLRLQRICRRMMRVLIVRSVLIHVDPR